MKTFFFLWFFLACQLFAGTTSFVWNANPATESVAEYTLYIGESSGDYPGMYASLTNLIELNLSAGTYYAVVTASNEFGESPPSDEIVFTVAEDFILKIQRLSKSGSWVAKRFFVSDNLLSSKKRFWRLKIDENFVYLETSVNLVAWAEIGKYAEPGANERQWRIKMVSPSLIP